MLENLKILDFSTLLPGPFATMNLADYGADVINIVSPGKSDLVLDMEPFISEGMSANRAWLNRNKRSLELNLKKEGAKEVVKKLIRSGYDIIVEQFRPGVMKKFSLSYEDLKDEFPNLIYVSITGYGQSGKDSTRAGHDINFLAKSGIMSHSGRNSASLSGMQIGDLASGSANAVIGLLMAAYAREHTKKGTHIDISMFDGLLALNSLAGACYLAGGKLPRRREELLNGGSNYDFYETKDNRYIAVGSLEPKFWKGFCEAIERPDLIENTITDLTIKPEIERIIKSRDYCEWKEIFANCDACVEPVQDLSELKDDEHVKSRELIVKRGVCGREVLQFNNPIKFSNETPKYKEAKKSGEDNLEILKSLGYDEEEIGELTK